MRHSRQTVFPGIGPAGQARIRSARALVAGCGGLGAEAASLLARAGVGFLRIVDRDVVEITNLQRQALFDEDDVRERRPKAVAAARRLARVASDVAVEPVFAEIAPGSVLGLVAGVDVVVDGLDNLEGRYLLNDACVREGIPWVYGASIGSEGVSALVVPGRTPCLRCLEPDPPGPGVSPTCATEGVLGPAAHAVASLEAAQALRWLVTREVPDPPVLVSVDVWRLAFHRAELPPRNPSCRCCGERRFEFLGAGGDPAGGRASRSPFGQRS